jgi:hypothetical protein
MRQWSGILASSMRTALALALSAATVACSAASAGKSAEAAKAKLTFVRGSPLTLRGNDFGAGEPVRLTLVARKRTVKQLSASMGGSFVIRFPGVNVGRCDGFVAFAVGARGSRASVGLPHVYCAPR